MEGRIYMTTKELSRLEEIRNAHQKRQTIQQAADNLGLSKRQALRLSKELKNRGPRGLISKKVGAPSNHKLPEELRMEALELIKTHYSDFGPTLAHEYLSEKHHLPLSVSSVRNIMMENGIWSSRKAKKRRVFQLRQRRDCEGELIQVDASEHDWFEGRAPKCVLLGFVDDATSKIMHLRFAVAESLISYLIATREYIEAFGRPLAFYPDKHAVFRVNRKDVVTGTGMTQFGRAMKELDIQLICAHTPQAKGRIERRHRDLQDRLIKAMRLHNISDIETANAFLPSFIEDFNKRFAKAPHSTHNAHRPLLATHDLSRILCIKQERQLSKNLMLQYKNVIYQVISEKHSHSLRKVGVMVVEATDGEVTIEHRGEKLTAVPYNQMQAQAEVVTRKEVALALTREKKPYRPGRRHPWRRVAGRKACC